MNYLGYGLSTVKKSSNTDIKLQGSKNEIHIEERESRGASQGSFGASTHERASPQTAGSSKLCVVPSSEVSSHLNSRQVIERGSSTGPVTVAPTSFMASEHSFAYILAQKEQEMRNNDSFYADKIPHS